MKNNFSIWLKDKLNDNNSYHYILLTNYSIADTQYNLSELYSTFEESFKVSKNSAATLKFKMMKYVYKNNQKNLNPLINHLIYGSTITLVDKNKDVWDFIITAINYELKNDNIVINYTCEDRFAWTLSKRNVGYNIGNQDIIPEPRNLEQWINKILKDSISSEWHYIKDDSLDSIFNQKKGFEISGSNAYNALVELANLYAANIKVHYGSVEIKDQQTIITSKPSDPSFTFELEKNLKFKGLVYDPHLNLQDLSVSTDGKSIASILLPTGQKDLNDNELLLVPEIPEKMWNIINSDKWTDTGYYNNYYRDLLIDDPNNIDTITKNFLDYVNAVPYLENKLIDVSFYKNTLLLSNQEYDNIMNKINNKLRYINGKKMYYQYQLFQSLKERNNLERQIHINSQNVLAELNNLLESKEENKIIPLQSYKNYWYYYNFYKKNDNYILSLFPDLQSWNNFLADRPNLIARPNAIQQNLAASVSAITNDGTIVFKSCIYTKGSFPLDSISNAANFNIVVYNPSMSISNLILNIQKFDVKFKVNGRVNFEIDKNLDTSLIHYSINGKQFAITPDQYDATTGVLTIILQSYQNKVVVDWYTPIVTTKINAQTGIFIEYELDKTHHYKWSSTSELGLGGVYDKIQDSWVLKTPSNQINIFDLWTKYINNYINYEQQLLKNMNMLEQYWKAIEVDYNTLLSKEDETSIIKRNNYDIKIQEYWNKILQYSYLTNYIFPSDWKKKGSPFQLTYVNDKLTNIIWNASNWLEIVKTKKTKSLFKMILNGDDTAGWEKWIPQNNTWLPLYHESINLMKVNQWPDVLIYQQFQNEEDFYEFEGTYEENPFIIHNWLQNQVLEKNYYIGGETYNMLKSIISIGNNSKIYLAHKEQENEHRELWQSLYKDYGDILLEASYNSMATNPHDLLVDMTQYFNDLHKPEINYDIAILDTSLLQTYSSDISIENTPIYVTDQIQLINIESNDPTDLLSSVVSQRLFITGYEYKLRESHMKLNVNYIKYTDKLIKQLVKLALR